MNTLRRPFYVIAFHSGLIFALIASMGYGCVKKQPYHTESRLLMGTVVEITCQDKQAIQVAFREMEDVERLLSIFDDNSEISQLNKRRKLNASWKTLQILKKCKSFYETSSGAFDITAGPLVDIWKDAIEEGRAPSERSITRAKKLVDSNNIVIDEVFSTAKLSKRRMKLDLGAVAKGYAVDVAIRKLKEIGITSCLINAGGDIYCLGKKNNRPWQIGIQHPRNDSIVKNFVLTNRAVATSGDYEQFFVLQNKRYSHIINPYTGYPADSGVVSVTVIADDCITADALATSIFVLGKEKGEELARAFANVQTIIFTEDDLDV
ncbi:FAD:protein FMN transferase [Candidatus Omnitrophota bacterium]